jgi:hypothetical protein
MFVITYFSSYRLSSAKRPYSLNSYGILEKLQLFIATKEIFHEDIRVKIVAKIRVVLVPAREEMI